MELNEVHNEHEHATTSLKVILLVFAIVLVGALGYLVWAANTAPDTTDNSDSVIKKTTTETATPSTSTTTPSVTSTDETSTATTDETATWETYTSTALGFSIKYPKDWDTQVYNTSTLSSSDSTKYCDAGSLGLEKSSPGDMDMFIGVCTTDSVETERNKLQAEGGNMNLAGKSAIIYTYVYSSDKIIASNPSYYTILNYKTGKSFKIDISAESSNYATIGKIIKTIRFL